MKTKLIAIAFFIFTTSVSISQNNVGIGTTNPHGSAILELNSENQGILIPRLTLSNLSSSTTPINSPAQGLLVYNIGGSLENGFYYWTGSEWKIIGSGGGGSVDPVCFSLQAAYECNDPLTSSIITTVANAPFRVNSSIASNAAVQVVHSANGVAISAANTSTSAGFACIQATTASNQSSSAIYGLSTGNSYGLRGDVASSAAGEAGVYGQNERATGGHGVMGLGYNGVVGQTNKTDGFGVYGSNAATADPGVGVYGLGITGVAGQSTNTSLSYGLYSFDDCGVYNHLDVGGNLFVNGTKSFRIDHPKDPDNKFLVHFCIESNEVLNIYRGSVVVDNNGNAEVILPEYLEEINTNFTYQLTPVGKAMPGLFISKELSNSSFSISGGEAGHKVSWVLVAERNDKLLQSNPELKNPEPLKTGKYKNKYSNPQLWGKNNSTGIMNYDINKLDIKSSSQTSLIETKNEDK